MHRCLLFMLPVFHWFLSPFPALVWQLIKAHTLATLSELALEGLEGLCIAEAEREIMEWPNTKVRK